MFDIGGVFDVDSQTPSFGVFSGVLQLCNKLLRHAAFFYCGNGLIAEYEGHSEGAVKRNKEKQVAFLSQRFEYSARLLPIEFPLFNQFAILSLEMLLDVLP